MLLLTVVAGVPMVPTVAAAVAESAPVTENLLALIAGAVVGAGIITATVLLFFLNEMSKNRALVYSVKNQLSGQMTDLARDFRRFGSRHNREDDDRFDILKIKQWQTDCNVARLDGKPPPVLETFPRRRYLDEDEVRISDVKVAGIVTMPDSS